MRSNLAEFRLVPQFTATVITKDWLTVTARSPPVSWGDQTVSTSFSSGKIEMMRSRQNRVLHLQVDTEEMYGSLVRIDRAYSLEATEPILKFIFGMSRPEIVFECSMGTKNLSRLSPGPRINDRWLRALSIETFASGTLPQVSAFVSWRVIGLTSVRWTSAGRESDSSLGPGMALSGFGSWRPARCCKNSGVIGTGFIMLFSTKARLESCQGAAIVRSGSGKSARDIACD